MIDWTSISSEDFEKLCTALLYKNNFHDIQRMGGSGDRSRDIKAYKRKTILSAVERDEFWIIQCKRFTSRPPTINELRKELDWYIAHEPDGIIFFITNRLPADTQDWIEGIKNKYLFEINIVDIDYLENELSLDSKLFDRFFKEGKKTDESEGYGWYDQLIGPRTHDLMIYTAGEMPEEAVPGAMAEWRRRLEKEVKTKKFNVGFFHPEFFGCDHTGINAVETVAMDKNMIQKADALIAYLNNEELYGTITEIMLAYFQNKKIAIFIDESILYRVFTQDTEDIQMEEYGSRVEELYSKVYKTKHFCNCCLWFDGPSFLVENKYWFLLTLLSQTRKDIIIEAVDEDDYVDMMSATIEKWLTGDEA